MSLSQLHSQLFCQVGSLCVCGHGRRGHGYATARALCDRGVRRTYMAGRVSSWSAMDEQLRDLQMDMLVTMNRLLADLAADL
jgi:hypothetical protein